MAKVQESTQWVPLPLLLNWELEQRFTGTSKIMSDGVAQAAAVADLGLDARVKQRIVNLLPEKNQDGSISLRQRERIRTTPNFFDKAATVTIPRGIYWANTISRLIELWDTTLYVWSADDTYTTVTAMGSASTGGPGGFCEGVNTAGTAYCFASTVGKSVVITSSGNTTVVDADFPASIIPMPVSLDGYIFVAQQSSRSIYNSAVGDATSWAASTLIAAEEEGGFIVGLVRHHKYVVALCENRIEFFRDAAIPAPNSPLIRVPELVQRIGCVNRATIYTYKDVTYFVGRDASGIIGVYKLEDTKLEKISNPSIDHMMSIFGGSNKVFGLITTWNNSTTNTNFTTGYGLMMHSKFYYSLHCNLGRVDTISTTSLDGPLSWVYDPEFKIWLEISVNHRNTAQTTPNVQGGWPYPFGTVITSGDANILNIKFLMQMSYGGTANNDLAEIESTASSGEHVSTAGGFIDPATAPFYLIQWPLTTLGTPNRKSLSGVKVMDIGFTGNTVNAGTFKRYGQYNVAGSESSYYSISLGTPLGSVTPPEGERVWTLRVPMGSFTQNFFILQAGMLSTLHISGVYLRITVHEIN